MKKEKVSGNKIQTIKRSRIEANEIVADVFNNVRDWKGMTVAVMTYDIVRKLGWKGN